MPYFGPNPPLKIEISNFPKKYPYLSSNAPFDTIKVRKKSKMKKKFEMGGYPLGDITISKLDYYGIKGVPPPYLELFLHF